MKTSKAKDYVESLTNDEIIEGIKEVNTFNETGLITNNGVISKIKKRWEEFNTYKVIPFGGGKEIDEIRGNNLNLALDTFKYEVFRRFLEQNS